MSPKFVMILMAMGLRMCWWVPELMTMGGGGSGVVFIFYGSKTLASSIDASNADVKLIGEDAGDSFGFSVSGAGDVNDDGIDDVIVGAYADDDGGASSGVTFIFYGSTALSTVIDGSGADVKLIGEDASDYFGRSVSGAGDVNGDGIDDVIIGANGDDDGGAGSGVSFIIYGSPALASLIDGSEANVKLIGESGGDGFGRSVSGGGDINGDGMDDVIVGADTDDDGGASSGVTFIFYGSKSLASSIDGSSADVKLIGESAGDYFGRSVSGAGDVNNDGLPDVIVGAYADDDGGNLSGVAFIIFGAKGLSGSIDASAADVKLIGEDATDYFGVSVSGAGDINNDGIDDVIVGADGDDDGGAASGVSFVFFGSKSLPGSIDGSSADIKLIGGDASNLFGAAVSGGGDVNGDGIDDIVVGALVDDDGGNNSGVSFVFYGGSSLASSIDASAADVILIGEDAGDFFGNAVSGGF